MTGNQAKMTDEEMKQMDEDLAEHFTRLEAKAEEREPRDQMVEGFTEEDWEEELANHSFFKKKFEDGEDLKYSPEDNTPEELAKKYTSDETGDFSAPNNVVK